MWHSLQGRRCAAGRPKYAGRARLGKRSSSCCRRLRRYNSSHIAGKLLWLRREIVRRACVLTRRNPCRIVLVDGRSLDGSLADAVELSSAHLCVVLAQPSEIGFGALDDALGGFLGALRADGEREGELAALGDAGFAVGGVDWLFVGH